MTRAQRIKAAAARYGLTNPSPDDVLSEAWPNYNHDAIHTAGYHADYDAVIALLEAKNLTPTTRTVPCKVCGKPVEIGVGNRRYCSPECNRQRAKAWKATAKPAEGATRRTIVALYVRRKVTIENIAHATGVSADRIRATLKAEGIEIRGGVGKRARRVA